MTGDSKDRSRRHAADLALVRSYLAEEPAARQELSERLACVPRLLGAAHRRLGRPLMDSELADLSQDVVARILEKLGTFQGRATLETWAFRVCHLELMNRMRRQDRRGEKGRPSTDDVPEPAEEAKPVTPMEYDHLDGALTELGPPEEDVIRLKHYEGLTFDEIAERLDMPANTAKTRYYRGMRWLRERLDRGEDEA